MSEDAGTDLEDAPKQAGAKLPRSTIDAIKAFLDDHGEKASAVLQPVGRAGVRITLVGADGALGDQLVEDLPTANAVVASFDMVEVSEWDRQLTSVVSPVQGHFKKMAGWVARQTRFPKPR